MASSQQWTFGASTLQRVVESEGPLLSPFEIFADCTQAHLDANRNWLQPRFQDAAERPPDPSPSRAFWSARTGSPFWSIACGGNDKERARPQFHRAQWPWLDTACARPGVAPEDIDIVLCTHLHVDHVGWNTRLENGRWVPTFPNARYLIAQREWDYWRNAGPAALVRTGDFITDSVLPIIRQRAGRSDRRRARDQERHLARARARPYARPDHDAAWAGRRRRRC